MANTFDRLKLPAVLIFLMVVPFLVTSRYNMHLIVMAGICAIMAIGLDIIMGYAGQLSLAQASFYGIGAYTSALLSLRLGQSFWVGLVAAVLVALFTSFVVGYISLRARGTAFVIMSFSFQGIVHLVALNFVALTNGQMGLARIPAPSIAGFSLGSQKAYYYLVLVFVLLTYYIAVRLTRSRIGRAWVSIRENELLAESLGVDPFRYSLFAFMAGSSMAGLSGSLYAHYASFISPETLSFGVIIILLVMTVLGGKGTIVGPVIGAVIFTVIPEYLRIADDLRLPIFGALLIVLALFMPKGLVPFCQGWLGNRSRGKGVAIGEHLGG